MSLKAIMVKIGARVGMCGLEQRPERTACQLTKAHASHRPTEKLVVEHIWAAHRANGADQQAASGRGKREGAGQTAMIETVVTDLAVPSPASARVAKGGCAGGQRRLRSFLEILTLSC